MRWTVLLILVVLGTLGMTTLQDASRVNPRNLQLRQLEWQEGVLLAMADSMPEELYRDRVTPEQRDFAQQLLHAAGFPPQLCAGAILGETWVSPDTALVLNSADAMKGFITESFTMCKDAVRNQSDEDRAMMVPGFLGEAVPKSELLDQAYLHSVYTLGEVVANFRKHGMAPPAFRFF